MSNLSRIYTTLPALPSAGPLDRYSELLGILVPVARTNAILNPSVETNTTGYTAVGGSIARTTTQQYHGAYSLAITPTAATTDGAYYGGVDLTSGVTYAVSCKVLGSAGVPYKLSVATTGGVDLVSRAFVGTGFWQWIWLFWTETSSTTRRIYLTKNTSTSTAVFYLDGLQLEACGSEGVFVTTYIDGDQQGYVPNQSPPAYLWNGPRHASPSSRSGQTRTGGRIVRFRDLGFLLTALIGLGLTTPRNEALGFAQLDGAQYRNSIKPQRSFSLVGRWQGGDPTAMDAAMGQAGRLVDRDRIALRQELALCLQARECNQDIGDPLLIPRAVYQGGMEGNTQELPVSMANLTFTQYLPYVVGRDAGAALDVQDSFSAYHLAIRTPGGVWSNMGAGITTAGIGSTAVRTFGTFYSSGQAWIVAGGDFGALGFAANTVGIGYYNPLNNGWGAMGTGGAANAIVNKVLSDPAGNIYAFGGFTAMGGAATSAHAARWSPLTNTWTGLNAPGAVSFFQTAAVGPNGTFYTADGATIRQYVPSTGTWSTLGTAAGGSALVYALTVGPDGSLYVGGSFTSISAVSMNGVGRYTLTAGTPAWEALTGGAPTGVPANGTISDLAFDAAGRLYATVYLIVGTTGAPFHQWNGVQWTIIGALTLGSTSGGRGILPATSGSGVYVFGDFTTANGVTLPERVGLWNGATVVPLDIDMPGSRAVLAMGQLPDGTLVLSRFDSAIAPAAPTSGTSTASGLTTLSNAGTAATYPTLTITGPSTGSSRIYHLMNTTTGATIDLNYTINAGEVATLVLDPLNLSFTSTFQGNIINTILPGSATTQFILQPGSNTIACFAADSTVTATLSWSTRYVSLNDALYQASAP